MSGNWLTTTLGEVADVVGGGTPSTSNPEYWGGEIIWLTPTEVASQDGKEVSNSIRKITVAGLRSSGARMLPKGSVILTSRASVGFVAISGAELCTNQGFQSLVPRESVIAKFLMFWIQQNRVEFESRAAGSTFKEISPTNVKSIKVLLPPLKEQKRIVDLISSLDSYVESLGAQAMKAMIARNAVLHELITSHVVDWNSYKFKDVATATKGKLPRDKNEAGQGIPYLTANFLRTNKADFWIQNTDGAVMADDGDCLILWDGAGAGDLFSAQNGVVSSTMAVVKAKRPDITKEFLTLYISSKSSYIKETCRGTTVPHVSPDAINNMDVFIPSISEQNRIVDLISFMDETVDTLEVAHNAAKKLRAGLLFDLLTGNHAIPSSYDKVLGAAQ